MIPYFDLKKYNQSFEPGLTEAVQDVVSSGRYLLDSAVGRFEQRYAEYIGTDLAVGCANGLDAITLILRGYMELGQIKPGDSVLTPANTFFATVLAITRLELTPVLVDADPTTGQTDCSLLEKALTDKCRALLTVHLYGRCSYNEQMAEFVQKHNLLLIEDNAQAHGCMYKGHSTGSLGHAAAHSFYPSKNLGALGDGGAITTDNADLANVVRSLANYGSSAKYMFDYAGMNSRLDEIQAAVLSVKLSRLDEDTKKRREIADMYYSGIDNPLVTMFQKAAEGEHVYHIFPIFCAERERLQNFLAQQGIQTLIHYPVPPHRQSCYCSQEWAQVSMPVTERIHATELSLPLNPALDRSDISKIISAINSFK